MLSHSTSFGSAHRSQKKLQNIFFKRKTPVRAMATPFDLAWRILKKQPQDKWSGVPLPAPPGEIELDQPTGYILEDVMDGYGDLGGRTRWSPIYTGDEGRSDPHRNMDIQGGNQPLSQGPLRERKRGDPARSPRFTRPGFRGPAMPLTDKSASRRSQ